MGAVPSESDLRIAQIAHMRQVEQLMKAQVIQMQTLTMAICQQTAAQLSDGSESPQVINRRADDYFAYVLHIANEWVEKTNR